jgi:DNA-binding CsgD family transcriptional regulator
LDPATLESSERVQLNSLLMTCRLGLGDLSSASLTGEDLRTLLEDAGLSIEASVLALLAQGELATAMGQHDAALSYYEAAGRNPLADDPDMLPWRAGAVMALVRTGRRGAAIELAREQMRIAEDSTDPHLVAIALRTLATADPAVDAVPALQRAHGLAVHSSDLRLVAQISADIAGLVLLSPAAEVAGLPVIDPRELLRDAEAFASTEGLWPLHARISRLLDRAGERPEPLDADAFATLTNAEQRVARLAAQGLTNRQIAEQLTVTVKGVEWHLSRVYRKLGIDSRNGLTRLAAPSPAERLA